MVCAVIGAPTISFAKARSGGGGYSSGSRSSGSSGSFGSRGARTYDQNGAKPIEQTTTTRPTATSPPPAASSQAPTAQPASAPQPSFLQRHPLMAGIAAGVAGSWIGHMLFGATDSSAKTNEAGEQVGATGQTAGGSDFTSILLLMLLAGGALYYFLKSGEPPPLSYPGYHGAAQSAGRCWQSLLPQPCGRQWWTTRSPTPTKRRFSNC